MSRALQVISLTDAQQLVAGRLAQLDQAIAVLGPDTLLGRLLGDTRTVWLTVQQVFVVHPTRCQHGTTVECALRQVTTAHSSNPFMQVAADELMTGFTGATTIPEMVAWLLDPREDHPS